MKERILPLAARSLLLCVAIATHLALGRSEATQHFHWSEHLAHELSYQHTIANARELTETERSALLTFVLHRFTHPVNQHDAEMFDGIPDEQLRKLAAATRIELVDLNGDGKAEILAQGNGLGPCGATGNCIMLVLRRTPTGLHLVLDSRLGENGGGFEKIRIINSIINGFSDIALASHISASDRIIEVFHFIDGRYRRSDRYYFTIPLASHSAGPRQPEISKGCPDEK